MKLTTVQLDRACGVLLATAAGDALGAGYEFGSPFHGDVAMSGGGGFGWAPGEWTDDTSMAIAIAEVAAEGADLRDVAVQDRIVDRWVGWACDATDVGVQTRDVLQQVRRGPGSAAAARAAAQQRHARTGRSGGNGSLMRTAPVALAYLDDPVALAEAVSSVSALTHYDPEAGEACALWCLAIRHAVLTGDLDVRVGLAHLPAERAAAWADRLDTAERRAPRDFHNNGWVVEALQAAWCAIATTSVSADDPAGRSFRADHLRHVLEAAVRGGGDTDTVAAIAGGLLGAAYGASAVPARWRLILHGWPGLRAGDLIELAAATVRGGKPDPFDFTYAGYALAGRAVPHPYDDGVLLGDVGVLGALPEEVDAVVSLCRVDPHRAADARDWVEVRLVDTPDPAQNANLAFVLDDTVTAIEALRAAGRTVFVHCVQAHSRTPTVAALYGMRRRGVSADRALADVRAALREAYPNHAFVGALRAAEAAASR